MNLTKKNNRKSSFIILIDPDKVTREELVAKVKLYDKKKIDYFFVGSSQPIKNDVGEVIQIIKDNSDIPVIIFPGSPEQLRPNADAILFISLISGRNPDFLISSHVHAAPVLKKWQMPVLPTAYILIESGKETSVERISGTKPLSRENIENIANHALAGEMLGMQYVYLEAGSGAKIPVTPEIVKQVKDTVSIPVIVGGGIRESDTVEELSEAGADFIVIGNHFEKEIDGSKLDSFLAKIK